MRSRAKWFVGGCAALVAIYALVAWRVPRGPALAAFGDLTQFALVALAVVVCLLRAGKTSGRERQFWVLLTAGSFLWMLSQLEWVWYEVFLRTDVPDPSAGDVALFLHVVPFMAALALRPHRGKRAVSPHSDSIDFTLLLLWWVFLYMFVVLPWQFVVSGRYHQESYNLLYLTENLVVVLGSALLAWRTVGAWKRVYSGLAASIGVYTLSSFLINQDIISRRYYTGSFYDLPLVAAISGFVGVGLLAAAPLGSSAGAGTEDQAQSAWPAQLATLALISMPLIALWNSLTTAAPALVIGFRLRATLGFMLLLTLLLLLKDRLLNLELQQLLRKSRDSFERLQRMQNQLVHSEKLAALGQLVAGAAHEINNPLTAILGYSEILSSDHGLGEQPRSLAEKIGAQARRTKRLVANMLSFAQQQPAARAPVQVNPLLGNAVQLREPDLAGKKIRIIPHFAPGLPEVLADGNHLLQVFLHILNNAVDALEEVGGGALTLVTRAENGNVLIDFSDTGPGIKDPTRIFDPFYTTKPVGKGTGLGLSVCYGVIQDHGGEISCYTNSAGGASFLIKLPALAAPVAAPPKPLAAAEPAQKLASAADR